MHLALVVHGVPGPDAGGTLINGWGVINWSVARGHRVSVYALIAPDIYYKIDEHKRALDQLKVELSCVPQGRQEAPQEKGRTKIGRLLAPWPIERCFPTVELKADVQALLVKERPDVILAQAYEGLATIYDFPGTPKAVLFGDPNHLVRFHRWNYERSGDSLMNSFRSGSRILKLYWHQRRYLAKMLSQCQAVMATAAHHAKWYGKVASRPCSYVSTPVVDVLGDRWRELRPDPTVPARAKLLHVSNLAGTANRPGIDLFVNKAMPELDRILGSDAYEVHFVGRPNGMPRSLGDAAAARPDTVKIRGFVDDIVAEYLSSDIVVVPTPERLGNRVRIASAFSFGCCVVSHTSNRYGMPELVHNQNLLMARDGRGFAEQVVRALKDTALRGLLQQNARKTYENNYSAAVVSAKIGKIISDISVQAGPSQSTRRYPR